MLWGWSTAANDKPHHHVLTNPIFPEAIGVQKSTILTPYSAEHISQNGTGSESRETRLL